MPRIKNRIQLGVLSDEFFDLQLCGYGYGWATRMLAECFTGNPSLGVDIVFLTNRFRGLNGRVEERVHDTRLVMRGRSRLHDVFRLRAEKLDLLLTIDYNLGYRFHCVALPRTPVMLWVRDPRTTEDTASILTTRIPGQEDIVPQGPLTR